jgi:1-aminocyclopropane-1-carboxylate deaminase
MKIETQEISLPILEEKNIRLFVKRLDTVHPFISGNKWFKLKYNLIEAKKLGYKTLLTFGGAYSNHISATAFSAKEKGFRSIGIIRGEEHFPLNSTLSFARENKMELHYISRSDYRLKNSTDFLDNLRTEFGEFYLLPEGGTNELAIKGTSEIIERNDMQDYICCSAATGGTIAGVINAAHSMQQVIGFPAIKGSNVLVKDIKLWTKNKDFKIIDTYCYGGYAKVSKELIQFINNFHRTQNILLDAIYTGKMMMGILDLVSKDYFKEGSTILALHTGGLQGNKGISERLEVRFYS